MQFARSLGSFARCGFTRLLFQKYPAERLFLSPILGVFRSSCVRKLSNREDVQEELCQILNLGEFTREEIE